MFVKNSSASGNLKKSISSTSNAGVQSAVNSSPTGLRRRQAPTRSRAATSTVCCTALPRNKFAYIRFTADRIIHRDLKPENILLTEATPLRESRIFAFMHHTDFARLRPTFVASRWRCMLAIPEFLHV